MTPLIFAIFCSLMFPVALGGTTCPLGDWNANLFEKTPTPVPSPSSCEWYSKSSCCKAAFSTSGSLNKFAGMTTACEDEVSQILCSVCDPDQETFVSRNTGGDFNLKVCKSICQAAFTACSEASYESKKISTFASADDFCVAIMNSGTMSTTIDSGGCFQGGAATLMTPVFSVVLCILFFVL